MGINLKHREHLRSEGFSEENISWMEYQGVRSLSSLEAEQMSLAKSSGLYFPFNHTFGQLRLDYPGRGPKYKNQKGAKSAALLPDDCRVVTEGAKDAYAGTLHGNVITAALAGVSHYKCLPRDWHGVILFDFDGWQNPQVFRNLINAALWVDGRVQLIPEIEGEPKAGLCEYFKAGHGPEDYKKLVDSAMSPKEILLKWPEKWHGMAESKLQDAISIAGKLAVKLGLAQSELNELAPRIAQTTELTVSEVKAVFAESTKSLNPNNLKIAYHQVEGIWGKCLQFNEHTKEIELHGNPIDIGAAKVKLAVEENLLISTENLELVLSDLARKNSYHPIREYLQGCYARCGDDPTILDNLADSYFGTSEPFYNVLLKRTLIGAVARIMEPGCKLDTALVFQGKQGIGKSSFFFVLAGKENFDDSLGAINDKDEKLKLHITWFLEWAELENVFRRKGLATIKAFLSCAVDVVRVPYGRQLERMRRQSIIVGTTNEDEFLTDATGNRRFWVIPVRTKIDTQRLKTERDRIWAAAYALYKAGEQWWLTPAEEAQNTELTALYRTTDPWLAKIETYIAEVKPPILTTAKIMTYVLKLHSAQQTRTAEMRVTTCLKELGWQKGGRGTQCGKRRQIWVNPEQSG